MNRSSLKQHLAEDSITYDFTLHLRVMSPHYMILEVSRNNLWRFLLALTIS